MRDHDNSLRSGEGIDYADIFSPESRPDQIPLKHVTLMSPTHMP